MAGDRSSRTEKPTPRKRKEAREEGRVPRTSEPIKWSGVLLATMLVPWVGAMVVDRLAALLADVGTVMSRPEDADAARVLGDGLWIVAVGAAPTLVLGFVLTVFGRSVQGGVVFAPKALKPKWSRLSPKQGLKRIFSTRGLWETAKATLRLVVIGAVVVTSTVSLSKELSNGLRHELATTVPYIGGRIVDMVQIVALVGIVLGLADYAFQRWSSERDLRMTKHEVKRDLKNAEGDPLLKSRLRSAQTEMSRNRMLAQVGNATVLVVNPTHVSVAIGYDGGDSVPRVLAKGADHLAFALRRQADEHGVPVVESVPLARALWSSVEVGSSIPRELYEAVALVLAFVFRLRGPAWADQVHRLRIPVPDGFVTDEAWAGTERDGAGTREGANTGAGRDDADLDIGPTRMGRASARARDGTTPGALR